jgi:hypothetical protein
VKAVYYTQLPGSGLAVRCAGLVSRCAGLAIGTAAALSSLLALSTTARAQPVPAATARATSAAAAATPPPSTAPQPRQLRATPQIEVRSGVAYASVSAAALIDNAAETKLRSGATSTIAIRVYLAQESHTRAIAVGVRTCTVAYDVWDEIFRVRVENSGTQVTLAALNVDSVRRMCTDIRGLAMTLSAPLEVGAKYQASMVAELNPVSAAELDAMRKWASGGGRGTSAQVSDTLFGAFVGIFVRPQPLADRVLRVVSEAIVLLPPPARTVATTKE